MFKKILNMFSSRNYKELSEQSASWLQANWKRVEQLFSNTKLARYIFEPLAELWDDTNPKNDDAIRRIISQVAIANAVIAGLPGKLGIGIFVAIALEIYMAIQIGRRIGVKVDGPSDILKYLGFVTGIAFTILELFRNILGVFFSFFALIGFLPATALAELFATSLVGCIFWIGFEEVKQNGSFVVPRRLFKTVRDRTTQLVKYQWRLMKKALTPKTYRQTAERLAAWLTGDIVFSTVHLRGDLFVPVAFAYLLSGQERELQGPLGQIFIQAIKDTNPDVLDYSDAEIGEYIKSRVGGALGFTDPEKLQGMESLIRGRMFELMVEQSGAWEGQGWNERLQKGELHDDFNYPGTDIVFTDIATGETIEVQLKATSSAAYIEKTLLKYPEHPIIVTSEVGQEFNELDLVQASVISNEELKEVTKDNFDELLANISQIQSSDMAISAAAGSSASILAMLWPFFIARLRGRITHEQMSSAFEKILPHGGAALAQRVIFGVCFGPIYAWWVLARGVMSIVPSSPSENKETDGLRLTI